MRNHLEARLGLLDATALVAGSMIGSGIFIVSADITRRLPAPGWLLAVWTIAGVLTVAGALSYGRLAAAVPRAGGQYVYLTELYGPLPAVIVLGLALGDAAARGATAARPPFATGLSPGTTVLELGAAMVGALFSADAWANVTFTAGEVRDSRRTVPRALVLGTATVCGLYLVTNIAYLNVLPLAGTPDGTDALARGIQHAAADRVG